MKKCMVFAVSFIFFVQVDSAENHSAFHVLVQHYKNTKKIYLPTPAFAQKWLWYFARFGSYADIEEAFQQIDLDIIKSISLTDKKNIVLQAAGFNNSEDMLSLLIVEFELLGDTGLEAELLNMFPEKESMIRGAFSEAYSSLIVAAVNTYMQDGKIDVLKNVLKKNSRGVTPYLVATAFEPLLAYLNDESLKVSMPGSRAWRYLDLLMNYYAVAKKDPIAVLSILRDRFATGFFGLKAVAFLAENGFDVSWLEVHQNMPLTEKAQLYVKALQRYMLERQNPDYIFDFNKALHLEPANWLMILASRGDLKGLLQLLQNIAPEDFAKQSIEYKRLLVEKAVRTGNYDVVDALLIALGLKNNKEFTTSIMDDFPLSQ